MSSEWQLYAELKFTFHGNATQCIALHNTELHLVASSVWCVDGDVEPQRGECACALCKTLNNCCIDYAFASWKCVWWRSGLWLFQLYSLGKTVWPKLRCTKGTFYQMHTTISVCVLNQMFSIHVDSVALLQIIVCLWTTIKSIAKHKSMRSMMHLNKRRIFYWSLKSDALCVCVCMYVKHIHKKRPCRHLQMVHMKEESHLLLIAKSNFRRGNSQRSNKVNWKCVRYTTIA